MKTLKQRHWENCDKLIKCAYPCNSCYGCENNEVKEWLQEYKRQYQQGSFQEILLKELIDEVRK